mmetsp:Transcript_2161/g.4976  ORF Transcript_2161/g.4976 Transcript_2161/m.4976 type:complete len:98 (+) Transcript_2161:3129-3422(+)
MRRTKRARCWSMGLEQGAGERGHSRREEGHCSGTISITVRAQTPGSEECRNQICFLRKCDQSSKGMLESNCPLFQCNSGSPLAKFRGIIGQIELQTC